MNYEKKAVELMMIMRLFLIEYRTHILSKTPQHTSLGGGMLLIVENQQYTSTRDLGCLNCYRQHSTLKSQFLLVNFSFPPQFQIKKAHFPWYFLHTFNFLHKLQYFFAFLAATFSARLEKSAHMISSSLSKVLQVTNNQST